MEAPRTRIVRNGRDGELEARWTPMLKIIVGVTATVVGTLLVSSLLSVLGMWRQMAVVEYKLDSLDSTFKRHLLYHRPYTPREQWRGVDELKADHHLRL